MKKEIPIFFAVDDNYAAFLGVTLQSIKDNASREYRYLIHVLYTKIKDETKDKLIRMQDEDFVINFVDVESELLKIGNILFTRDYYTKTTYFRLFIQKLFPQYDKALYLDSDLLVLGDISELYNTDIKDNYVGAVVEDIMTNVDVFGRYVEECLGINRYKFFNAGVLLLNLKKFREVDVEAKFVDLISKFKFLVTQDEDYLNVICKGHVHFIEQGWNKSPIADPTFDPATLKLVHYKINYKPWHYDNVPFAEHYWEYAIKTEFYDILQNMKKNFTEEDAIKDEEGYYGLAALAEKEIARDDTYNKIINKK